MCIFFDPVFHNLLRWILLLAIFINVKVKHKDVKQFPYYYKLQSDRAKIKIQVSLTLEHVSYPYDLTWRGIIHFLSAWKSKSNYYIV
jgi:hypothetical protein